VILEATRCVPRDVGSLSVRYELAESEVLIDARLVELWQAPEPELQDELSRRHHWSGDRAVRHLADLRRAFERTDLTPSAEAENGPAGLSELGLRYSERRPEETAPPYNSCEEEVLAIECAQAGTIRLLMFRCLRPGVRPAF
jgi:hypothetical protein